MSDFDPSSDYEASPVSARRYIESDRVEGTAVYDVRGHRVGEVKRLIIEKVSGQVAYVIIAFEGFFGIGADNHAVAWSRLRYDQDLEGYRTDMTAEQLYPIYFEKRSFSSSGSRVSLTQRRSATTKGSRFTRTSKSATRRVRSSALAWQW